MVKKAEQLNPWHHVRKLLSMLKSIVSMQHRLDLFSVLKWSLAWRVLRILFLGCKEDLVQLDNNLVDELLLGCFLVIALHKLEKFNDHLAF